MLKDRNVTVDVLRGLAVFAMILIHTNAYYLSNKVAYHLWNWSQFAVPVFVFCSAYLYFKKTKGHLNLVPYLTIPSVLKRLKRLLIPYYWYVFFFVLLLVWTKPDDISAVGVVKYLTLTTKGNDIGWLVLLFVYFIFLFPVVDYLGAKKYSIFLLLLIATYSSTIYFLFFPSPLNFKLTMWLPWLIIVFQSWYIAHYEDRKNFFHSLIIYSLSLFLLVLIYKMLSGQSLSFYSNKYPPNIYYLSYGLFSTAFLCRFIQKLTLPATVRRGLTFLSTYSYSIFLIHTFVIFTIMYSGYKKHFGWVGLFIFVLVVTIVLQHILNYFFSILKKAN